MAHLVTCLLFNHEGQRLIPISHIENQAWWLMTEILELKRQTGKSFGLWVGHQVFELCEFKSQWETVLWNGVQGSREIKPDFDLWPPLACGHKMDIHAHTHRYTYKVHIEQSSIKLESTVCYKTRRKNDWRIESRRHLHPVCFLRFHLRQWKKNHRAPSPAYLCNVGLMNISITQVNLTLYYFPKLSGHLWCQKHFKNGFLFPQTFTLLSRVSPAK